jgi:hypothetical protein
LGISKAAAQAKAAAQEKAKVEAEAKVAADAKAKAEKAAAEKAAADSKVVILENIRHWHLLGFDNQGSLCGSASLTARPNGTNLKFTESVIRYKILPCIWHYCV